MAREGLVAEMNIRDKEWIARKREAVERGSFGITFDADDALSLLSSHESITSTLADEIARIENTAEQARYGGDNLREYQLSSIVRRLRKLVSTDTSSKPTELK